MSSVIDPAICAAYRETHYVVDADPVFTLRVDEPSRELLALQRAQGAPCSAFITAWNPYSERTDASVNAVRQSALEAEIRRQGLACVRGLGRHADNGWEPEQSVLVLGMALELAEALGRRFDQNAILWSADDAVPRLVLLR